MEIKKYRCEVVLRDLMLGGTPKVPGSYEQWGFKCDENGLYIESRQVKALIKETIKILYSRRTGRPRLWSDLHVWVLPDRIHLSKKEPDGSVMLRGHWLLAGEWREAISSYESVAGPKVEFTVQTALSNDIDWARVLEVMQENGLGAVRSQGYGRFDVMRWEPIAAI